MHIQKRPRTVAIAAAVLLALAAGLLAPSAASAVTFGQLDDFQGGTTMGWSEGGSSPNPPVNVATGGPNGAADAFLRNVSSGGFGPGSRQIMFNTAQWAGDFNTAGVTRIDAQLANFGSTTLNMRLSIEQTGGSTFGSTEAVVLPPDSVWRLVTFNLTSDSMTRVVGAQSLADVLANVSELRLLSAAGGPSGQGDAVAGTLGVDNVRALRLPGDANFDGAVNGTDFALLAQNFGTTGKKWNSGDFNFDTAVNGTDFSLLAQNFGRTLPSAASASLAVTDEDRAAVAAFGERIGVTAVPEPSCLWLLCLAPLLRRTRRG